VPHHPSLGLKRLCTSLQCSLHYTCLRTLRTDYETSIVNTNVTKSQEHQSCEYGDTSAFGATPFTSAIHQG
jgi:hypothetical protein